MMEEGSDYYVVRKGDVVAVYKTLSDCQAQICSSVCVTAWNYRYLDDCTVMLFASHILLMLEGICSFDFSLLQNEKVLPKYIDPTFWRC
jgi:hypothetical protein